MIDIDPIACFAAIAPIMIWIAPSTLLVIARMIYGDIYATLCGLGLSRMNVYTGGASCQLRTRPFCDGYFRNQATPQTVYRIIGYIVNPDLG